MKKFWIIMSARLRSLTCLAHPLESLLARSKNIKAMAQARASNACTALIGTILRQVKSGCGVKKTTIPINALSFSLCPATTCTNSQVISTTLYTTSVITATMSKWHTSAILKWSCMPQTPTLLEATTVSMQSSTRPNSLRAKWIRPSLLGLNCASRATH